MITLNLVLNLMPEFKMASITNYAYVWNKVGVSPSVGTNYTLYLKKVYTQLK
jgi:hypothetical protein